MIDPFVSTWLDELEAWAVQATCGSTYLLVDAAFLPDTRRWLMNWPSTVGETQALFHARPGADEATLQASPWLLKYPVDTQAARVQLGQCDGLPALTAIQTSESMACLLTRLRRWCTVRCDDMLFNFRYTDTRRLPGILSVLDAQQRLSLQGEQSGWRWMGRDGRWCSIDGPQGEMPPTTAARLDDDPCLNDMQFGALLRDSEADETLAALALESGADASEIFTLLPSQRHAYAEACLNQADRWRLEGSTQRVALCRYVLSGAAQRRLEGLKQMPQPEANTDIEALLKALEDMSCA
ncbi:MAG: DUF4123 domain-containing protein [Aquabacterium sp.]